MDRTRAPTLANQRTQLLSFLSGPHHVYFHYLPLVPQPSPPEENSPGHSTCDSGQGHQEFEKERLNQETENQELIGTQRNLHPDPKATKEELVERVKANFRVPRA